MLFSTNVAGELDDGGGAMREQLHDDVRQEGRASVIGRAGRGTQLWDLSGLHNLSAAFVRQWRGVVQRVVGRGQLDAAGPSDHQTAERLRGQHRLAREAPQSDRHDGPVGRQQHARADIAVPPDEYDQTHIVTNHRQLSAIRSAQTVGKTKQLANIIYHTYRRFNRLTKRN